MADPLSGGRSHPTGLGLFPARGRGKREKEWARLRRPTAAEKNGRTDRAGGPGQRPKGRSRAPRRDGTAPRRPEQLRQRKKATAQEPRRSTARNGAQRHPPRNGRTKGERTPREARPRDSGGSIIAAPRTPRRGARERGRHHSGGGFNERRRMGEARAPRPPAGGAAGPGR